MTTVRGYNNTSGIQPHQCCIS